jgi:transcriptional regulator with XRE-family HTH domain
MGLHEDLRKAVEKDGRSQREIAEAAGIHVVSLSRFMTGGRQLGLGTAETLARVLGYSVKLVRRK